MSDDFWVTERNNKLEEEKVKIRSELENVKTTRQLFVEDFSSRFGYTKYNEIKGKTFLVFLFIHSDDYSILIWCCFQRKGNENKSETKLELEGLRSRQLNKSSNVVKVRQELMGNTKITETEEGESSLQDVKITEPFNNTSETQDENSTIQISEKINNEQSSARGRKRSEFWVQQIISCIFQF